MVEKNSLIKILYSIYTGEYPNEFTGGPNNIIYKIIANSKVNNYHFDYLSKDLFAKNLTKKNIDTIIDKRTPKKKITSYFAENSKLYRKIFGSDFYLPYHFYKNEKYFKSFQNKVKDNHILHSQDSVSLALLDNAKTKNVKKIFTVHSKGPLSDEFKSMAKNKTLQNNINKRMIGYEKRSIKLADIITFPSYAAKEYFEESLSVKLNMDKVRIIYNGIEFAKIQNIKNENILDKYSVKKNNQLLLLNIAAHGREKNIDILLRTVEKIINKYKRNVSLINIGIGSDTKDLVSLTKELDVEKHVKFLGKIPNNDVIRLLKATDIFIMTSEKVIFDLVVLEALASGACCIVSNEGGNKEIIKDGENGFLIDIKDIDAIAKKIISILPHKDIVRENAVKTAKQFSVQKMVNEYFNVYESLLNDV